MTTPGLRGSEETAFELLLANVLRTGVAIAATVVLIGGIVYLWTHGSEATHYGVFRGEPGDLRSVRGILADAVHGHGRGLIQLGLLLLVATPVARVAFSAIGFLRERDWLYVSITLIVLALLLYGLLFG